MKKTTERVDVDGILLVNKPALLSSNTVLQTVKRLFAARKAGHMGSLDPLATGMLPICFGEATKFAQYGLDADKCYAVTALFGTTTDSGDAQGKILSTVENAQLSAELLLPAMQQFLGASLQVPPMYSALKHQGKKLYELARAGIEVQRQERPIIIHQFDLVDIQQLHAQFVVHCSKGTYIRSLMADLGMSLGLGAHVTQLHRIYTAGFEHQPQHRIEELQTFEPRALRNCLLPVDYMVRHLPKLTMSVLELQDLYQGRPVLLSSQAQDIAVMVQDAGPCLVRLYDEQQLFHGLGEIDPQSGRLQPKRLRASD